MGKGDQEEQGRYISLFPPFWGVLSCSVCLKSLWKLIVAEGMNVPLWDEHLFAAHPEEWYHSNVQITLAYVFLSFTSAFLLHLGLPWLSPPTGSTSTLILASDCFLEDEDKTECQIHHAV